jgi:hypothetical protein
LKPECPQDIVDHFNIIVNKDIAMGTYERVNNEFIYKSSKNDIKRGYGKDYDSNWGVSVQILTNIFENDWLDIVNKLKDTTYLDRIKSFVKGTNMYLSNGLPIFIWPIKNDGYCEIIEEKFENELIYPIEEHKHFADVVYNCNGCSKWTAKIGNREIKDKDGNNWWYTKHEAEIAARWFCNYLEYRIRNDYED